MPENENKPIRKAAASASLKNKQVKPTPGKRGGPRPGAGRPKGSGQIRVSASEAIKLAREGESPLAYMLRVMREDDSEIEAMLKKKVITQSEFEQLRHERQRRRDWAAQASAPYIHPKLSSVDMKVEDENKEQTEVTKLLAALNDDELESLHGIMAAAESRGAGGKLN